MAAEQRDAVLTGELEGVVAVPNLYDVRVQEVGRGAAIEIYAEHARGQKITEIPHVVLLEEGRVAGDAAREQLQRSTWSCQGKCHQRDALTSARWYS